MVKKTLSVVLLVLLATTTGCASLSTTIVVESKAGRGERPTVRVEFRPVIDR